MQNANLLIIDEKGDLVEASSDSQYILNENIMEQIENHKIENYFLFLKDSFLKEYINISSYDLVEITEFEDLKLDCEKVNLIDITKYDDHTDVVLKIELKPKENIEYFIGGCCYFCGDTSKILDFEFEKMKLPFFKNEEIYNNVNGINDNQIHLHLFSHFNKDAIKKTVTITKEWLKQHPI